MPSKGEKRREQQRQQRLRSRQRLLLRQKQKRIERRIWWEKLKNSLACKRCGMADSRCLEFHHRDPATKLFNVSKAAIACSMKVIMAEVEKCDVLCANCHRIIHWEERFAKLKE